MGWRDHLTGSGEERMVLPWVGGKSLRLGPRAWTIKSGLPPEHGWYEFTMNGRTARWTGAPEPQPVPEGILKYVVRGYLVGDRLVRDETRVDPDPKKIAEISEPVRFIEPGLDRFVRITAGRICEDGPLLYDGLDMPSGVEESVLTAFLDEKSSVDDIPGVTPALDAAFRMEVWQRAEAKRRREELEKRLREEAERRAIEERRKKLVEELGDAQGRREMAAIDFEQAARAALAVGGATFLDSRAVNRRGQNQEMVVKFRFLNRRFECTCDARTLRIIDSGICLIDHDTGEKGDTRFTLESLPSVIKEAHDDGKLVVFRHVA